MAWQDDIAEQRKEAALLKAAKDVHKENISAVTDSGKVVVDATDKLAKSSDVDGLIKQMKELQLTQLLSNQARPDKPSVILTDQTDLGDKISDLTTQLTNTVKGIDSSDINAKQLKELKGIVTGLSQLTLATKNADTSTKKALDDLTKSISKLVINPVVNVPKSSITVQSPKLDFSPLQNTIKEYFTHPDVEEKIDLDCYRAQDINNNDKNVQYVGFVNPKGNWYIIQNDMKANTLRYLFGDEDYSEAFSKASTYVYSLLNEAIDATTT